MRLDNITQVKHRIRPLRVLVYGAGGHGMEVAAAIRALGHEAVIRGGLPTDGPLRYVPSLDDLAGLFPDAFIVAIGDNHKREQVYRAIRLHLPAIPPIIVVHPAAWVAPSARLEDGVYVAANATVQEEAVIRLGSIVNTGAVVSHGCSVYSFVHLAPNSTLCGDVRVGCHSLIGAGSVVRERSIVHEGTILGCGAALVRDTACGHNTYAGVPARGLVTHGPQEQAQGQAGGAGSGESPEPHIRLLGQKRPAKKRR